MNRKIEFIEEYIKVNNSDYRWNDNHGELVRCKDCKWHENEQPGMVYCPAVVGGWVEEDWFCKGGERRGDADE